MASVADKFGLGSGGFPLTNGTAESNSILLAWYGFNMTATSVSISADQLFAVPLFVPTATIVDGIAFENTDTADSGDDVRLGIYSSTTGGLPGALLSETGEVALDGSRDLRIGTLGAAQTLVPGTKYWLALVANATVSVLFTQVTNLQVSVGYSRIGLPPWNAGFATFTGSNYGQGFYKTHTYGALPNPYGTPTAVSGVPIMGVQVQ